MNHLLGELKVLAVVGVIVGTVYYCAFAAHLDGESMKIRYWPALGGAPRVTQTLADVRDESVD